MSLEITDRTFEDEVINSSTPVLVDFWASWCIPCKAMEEIMERLEKELQGSVKVCKINVDRNPVWAGKFKVLTVPTVMIFRDGKEIDRKVAAQSYRSVREMLKVVL
jgi:thioredoxin 1